MGRMFMQNPIMDGAKAEAFPGKDLLEFQGISFLGGYSGRMWTREFALVLLLIVTILLLHCPAKLHLNLCLF